LWLRLESGWVLARGPGVVNCVELAHWRAHQGRIPETALYGQDFPEGLYTEGFAGSAAICVVSASGDAFWKEVNIEMLCRDIATTTLFEKDWEGDEYFQDWVAFYAVNFTQYSLDKKFVVIVKPTCNWSKFVANCFGLALDEVKGNVGRAQWRELNWISRSQARLACKWNDIEFLTAFAFLKKYCAWGEADCKAAASEKLLGYCKKFHTLEPAVCARELDCAFWCWMEAFGKEDFGLREQAAICHSLLQKLAGKEQRPALTANIRGKGQDAWAALLVEVQALDPETYSSLEQEPLYRCIQEHRRRSETMNLRTGDQRQQASDARRLQEALKENQKGAAAIQELQLACQQQSARIAELTAARGSAQEAREPRQARELAAALPPFVISGGGDACAHMWSPATGKLLRLFEGHEDQIWSCCLSPDETRLFTTSNDCTARMWSVQTGQCLSTFYHPDTQAPNWACVTPDMQFLATAVNDGTAKIWDIKSGSLLEQLKHGGGVNSVCMSPDGQFLFTASGDGLGRMWTVPSGELVRTFDGKHSDALYSCYLAGDGQRFFAASFDGKTSLFDVASGKLQRQYEDEGEANSVWATPSGDAVFIGRSSEAQSKVQMLDSRSGRELRTFLGHTEGVTAQWVSESGKWLCTSSLDGTAKVWDVASGETRRTYGGHRAYVQGIVGGSRVP